MGIAFCDYVQTLPEVHKTMNMILEYTNELVEILNQNYRTMIITHYKSTKTSSRNYEFHQQELKEIREGTYVYRKNFEVLDGRKYYKIFHTDGTIKAAHCFIDKKNGDVLKSKSWNSPADGVRYNLLDDQSRNLCFSLATWDGLYLYKKS